eukprot:4692251-Karenia_brevis.AAC.1
MFCCSTVFLPDIVCACVTALMKVASHYCPLFGQREVVSPSSSICSPIPPECAAFVYCEAPHACSSVHAL